MKNQAELYWIWKINLAEKTTGEKKTIEITLPFVVITPAYVLYRAYLEGDLIPDNFEVIGMPTRLKTISL